MVGDLDSSSLKFCRRVKYLGSAWILLSKSDKYYWLDQSLIPIDHLSKIKKENSVADDQQNLIQKKLDELVEQKEKLRKAGKESNKSERESERLMSEIRRENEDIRGENKELKEKNNLLQQMNIQHK